MMSCFDVCRDEAIDLYLDLKGDRDDMSAEDDNLDLCGQSNGESRDDYSYHTRSGIAMGRSNGSMWNESICSIKTDPKDDEKFYSMHLGMKAVDDLFVAWEDGRRPTSFSSVSSKKKSHVRSFDGRSQEEEILHVVEEAMSEDNNSESEETVLEEDAEEDTEEDEMCDEAAPPSLDFVALEVTYRTEYSCNKETRILETTNNAIKEISKIEVEETVLNVPFGYDIENEEEEVPFDEKEEDNEDPKTQQLEEILKEKQVLEDETTSLKDKLSRLEEKVYDMANVKTAEKSKNQSEEEEEEEVSEMESLQSQKDCLKEETESLQEKKDSLKEEMESLQEQKKSLVEEMESLLVQKKTLIEEIQGGKNNKASNNVRRKIGFLSVFKKKKKSSNKTKDHHVAFPAGDEMQQQEGGSNNDATTATNTNTNTSTTRSRRPLKSLFRTKKNMTKSE